VSAVGTLQISLLSRSVVELICIVHIYHCLSILSVRLSLHCILREQRTHILVPMYCIVCPNDLFYIVLFYRVGIMDVIDIFGRSTKNEDVNAVLLAAGVRIGDVWA